MRESSRSRPLVSAAATGKRIKRIDRRASWGMRRSGGSIASGRRRRAAGDCAKATASRSRNTCRAASAIFAAVANSGCVMKLKRAARCDTAQRQ